MPPISARGEDLTGGIVRIRNPDGSQNVRGEAVQYLGRKFFIGGGYSWQSHGADSVLLPLGFRIGEDDGLTRNVLQFVPLYNRKTGLGLEVNLELKL